MRTLPSPGASLATLAVAASLACPAAFGQSFTGTGPVRAFAIPNPSSPPPAGSDATVRAVPPPVRAAGPRLHRLPAHVDGLLLSGETATRLWALELTDGEAADPAASVQVSYRAAVSVSPESSMVSVRVNDRVIGSAPIRAPSANRTLRFAVPRGLLVRGANAVRISVEQRHRVDCSPEAAFELWTRIEPGATGLMLNGDPAVAELSDLSAVAPDANGHVALTLLRGPDRMSLAETERAVSAAQYLALAGRYAHPTVSVTVDGGRGRGGVDLAVGPVSRLPAAVDPALLGPVDGPRAAVLPAGPDAPPLVVVTGRDDREVDAALAILAEAAAREPSGSDSGRRALAERNGRAVVGGETLSLASLGQPTVEFAGRMFRTTFDLRLPADSLPADYDRLALRLAGGYEAGLAPDAQLRLEVNGGAAASIGLGKADGDTFRQQEMLLPLGRLQPGRNAIAITAALPTASDRSCSVPEGEAARRFTLSDRTAFVIPPVARAARLPELSRLAAGAFPYAAADIRPSLVVPSPDAASVGAAATVAVRMALAAGRAIPFAFRTDAPAAGTGPVLVVAPARALDRDTLKRIGLDPERLRTAWSPLAAEPTTTGSIDGGGGRRSAGSEVAACRGLLGEDAASPPPTGADRYDRERSWFRRLGAWLGGGAARPATVAAGTTDDLSASSLLVAQGVLPGSDGGEPASSGLVTIVSAPTAALLGRGVSCLVHPQVWEQLGGRLSLVDGASGAVRSVSADDPGLVLTQPFSVGNTRRIAAGWLSLHPEFFTLIVLGAAAILALATHWLVGNVGRRTTP